MSAHWIDIPTPDGVFQGYLKQPMGGRGPAILIIQEIFGVNAHIRSVADQYALDGFTALAPDLFWRSEPRLELGYDPDGRTRGIEAMNAIGLPTMTRDLIAAIDALRKVDGHDGRIVVAGYCLGGTLAYRLAVEQAVDLAISYYGGGVAKQLDDMPKVKVPVQFHFGETDQSIPMSEVEAVKAAAGARADRAVNVYPGAGHGFNCSVRASYDQHSAMLAHGRTLQFIAAHLPATDA
ncbi:dienelactone hydrolase family protein [soil metagenome]